MPYTKTEVYNAFEIIKNAIRKLKMRAMKGGFLKSYSEKSL